ncbi:hypothetical protein [Bosea sp. 685]|uniref:hypothetical protein n=1 Tax=Bosea sp. 685 TaxID=3080057 RepID=UPI002892A42F|nr:hypothetical protein [Bosea sp. 685]WNJ89609.1 hypothetical protein RMR04_24890 [Bosea sp. 685]
MNIARESLVTLKKSEFDGLRCQHDNDEVRSLARRIVKAMDTLPHGVNVRLGPWVATSDEAKEAAVTIATIAARELAEKWALTELSVEVDKPQISAVQSGAQYRTLLPHHDGGNCSFLTPSKRHVESWQVSDRTSQVAEVSTTRNHKLYQGFLVQEVGDRESLTPYYDLTEILADQFHVEKGRAPSSITELAAHLGSNLLHSLSVLREHGGGYVQLSSILGSKELIYLLVNIHHSHYVFSDREVNLFPDLSTITSNSRESTESTPVLYLFDKMWESRLGINWEQARKRYEHVVSTQKHDLVLGHNIILMHGGLNGGTNRILDPICLVMPAPVGEGYESWLANAWEESYKRRSVAGQ